MKGRVRILGKGSTEVEIPEGSNIRQMLQAAYPNDADRLLDDYAEGKFSFLIDDESVGAGFVLSDGFFVVLSPKVEGGSDLL